MKKSRLLLFLQFLIVFPISAQVDTVNVSNSCADYMTHKHPGVLYSYDDAHETHSYSGNWDFDGDKKTDSLLFIGTGGAHLYYQLKIVLSSGKSIGNFPEILLDMPWLGKSEELQGKELLILPQFVVYDFDYDEVPEIYIRLDRDFSGTIKGVHSQHILIKLKNGNLVFQDFRPTH